MRTYRSDLSWNFVVASPASAGLGDFKNSVIFLVEDGEDAATGVVINKPLDKNLSDISASCIDGDLGGVEVYEGGPVSIGEMKLGAFVLDDSEVGAFHYGISPQRLASLLRGPYEVKPMAFLGYVGWGRQQLRDELKAGCWFLSNVDTNIIFDVPPEDLWRELLMREFPSIADLDGPGGKMKWN